MAAHPGSNLPRGKKDSGPLREAAVIYLPMSGGGRHGEAWEMGHNFGETVRFWVFARRKGLHVHLSRHTDLYYPFTFHSSQGPQGVSLVAAADSPAAFLEITLQMLSTYPSSYLYSCSDHDYY